MNKRKNMGAYAPDKYKGRITNDSRTVKETQRG
jgi:hypothetical protein